MAKTLLAIGAHYDDCVFGVPGIMLQAIRKNYRVVILSLIGDYTNWEPIGNRQQTLLDETVRISREYGAEMRYLDFRSHLFEVDSRTKKAVAEVVADVAPDVALVLWNADRHDDHVVASQLSTTALHAPGAILGKPGIRGTRQIYYYDNGPGHTIGFEPTDYVDVSDEWPQAIDWLGRFMAVVRDQPYQSGQRDSAQQTKEVLASYRGRACGAKFAEAVRTFRFRARDIL